MPATSSWARLPSELFHGIPLGFVSPAPYPPAAHPFNPPDSSPAMKRFCKVKKTMMIGSV